MRNETRLERSELRMNAERSW